MNISNQIVILIAFSMMIVSVESIRSNPFARNYVSNMEKSIMNNCNKMALNKTSNYDVYNCIIDKNNNTCSTLENYKKFVNIRNECMTDIHAQCGFSVFIVIFSWIVIGLLLNN